MTDDLRCELLQRLAQLITQRKSAERPIVVGITGMDTSGKSEMTSALSSELRRESQHVQVVHIDDFHRPRAQRYCSDMPEPVQYYERSIDFERVARDILQPIRETGQLSVALTLLDLPSDTWTLQRSYAASDQTVVLVEGVFLFRPEVRDLIELLIYLHVDKDVVLERGRARDMPSQGEDVMRKYHTKYLPAQRTYLAAHPPESHADVIIDNSSWQRPTVSKWPTDTLHNAGSDAN
jgi:uridine kinase